MMLSSGETAPDWVLGCNEGALDCALAGAEGLDMGGRIECFLFARPEAGRGMPAIDSGTAASFSSRACDTCVSLLIERNRIQKQRFRKHKVAINAKQ